MGFCPNCKNEFVEGIKICPKCDVELIDKLKVEDNNLQPIDMLYNKTAVPTTVNSEDFDVDAFENALNEEFEITAEDEDNGITTEMAGDGEQQVMNVMREMTIAQIEKERAEQRKGPYQDKNEKVQEIKSSSFALITVGVGGIILLALIFFGIIPLQLSSFNRYGTCSIMLVLFIILIIGGIVSFKSIKTATLVANKENELTEEIKKWYQSNLTKDFIDDGLFEDNDETPEELKYYPRFSKLKLLLNDKFMNLEKNYQDHICEEMYNWLYENED